MTYHVPLFITRVVGPGTGDQFNGDGTLVASKWNVYTAQNIVSKTAHLSLDASIPGVPSFDTPGSLTAQVFVNGTKVKGFSLNGVHGKAVSFSACVDVPTSILKFAHLGAGPLTGHAPAADNGLAGNNDILVTLRGRYPGFGDFGIFGFNVQSVSFDAMAPVVLLHGIRAGAGWFQPYRSSPAGADSYAGRWFNQPFDAANAPYQAIDVNNFIEGSIANGGKRLADDVEGVAVAFGSHGVHIVAHSMGGLWSRAFLSQQLQKISLGLAVFSLTTLDTPHHGTYNADIRVAVYHAVHDHSGVSLTPRQRLVDEAPWSPGTPDLTTSNVESFNANNPYLPHSTSVDGRTNTLFYNSVSNDANIDNSCDRAGACDLSNLPTISKFGEAGRPDESEGYESPDKDIAFYIKESGYNVGQSMYRNMFQYKGVTTVPCAGAPRSKCLENVRTTPQLNDFNVTLTSARFAGFNEIASRKHNHTTVGTNDIGQVVFDTIKHQQVYVK